jgi:hypothetical protein
LTRGRKVRRGEGRRRGLLAKSKTYPGNSRQKVNITIYYF